MHRGKAEHTFEIMINKAEDMRTRSPAMLEKRRMRKLEGVKSEELMLWATINEIDHHRPVPPSGNTNFKGSHGITKTRRSPAAYENVLHEIIIENRL
ncbi:hypothetical protein MLD38_010290 [Melastoma candidum]|uniref:Uncharacterized protein n=1 Tax=Melastoma candidum TaxID=119954 RepID=A0ACB9R0M9_9MYRT|nr:hypothetical protein MLD38_010290 [Melastoma candidum]